MENILISYSGGRTSAYMTKMMLDNMPKDKYNVIVVFANTGKENEETLEFVKKCDDEFGFNTVWVEAVTNPEMGKGITAKIVTFETASRNGEPFEGVIKKYGIPNVARPQCSSYLKERPIRDYARQIGWGARSKYKTAIGIRADEIDRISAAAKTENLIYPLITHYPSTKNDISKWWEQQSFKLQLKGYEGNCDLCFKKSMRKLMTLVKEKPSRADWWRTIENKYPMVKSNNGEPHRFFRGNLTIDEIIAESKHPFEMSTDDSLPTPPPAQYEFPFDLDTSNGCIESCEVF